MEETQAGESAKKHRLTARKSGRNMDGKLKIVFEPWVMSKGRDNKGKKATHALIWLASAVGFILTFCLVGDNQKKTYRLP